MKNVESADIVIVGAGAAGLMTAIWAGRTAQANKTPKKIILFDSKAKIGAKILMSGGTRCNVTNREVTSADYEGEPRHVIKHVLEGFRPEETRQFFQEIGVALVLEPTGKYFPETNSAQTVLTALIEEMRRVDVDLRTQARVTQIKKIEQGFRLQLVDQDAALIAKQVVLTTGGLSHPTTGSDGAGYVMAKQLGHTARPTFPALTPLMTTDKIWQSLSGIAFPMTLSFYQNGKKQKERTEAVLFTHFGFSGPAALDISRYWASAEKESAPQIVARFLPEQNEESLKQLFKTGRKKFPTQQLHNFFLKQTSLPARFLEAIFTKLKINGETVLAELSEKTIKQLIQGFLYYPLEVSGVYGYQKAEVTAGGVDLREIHPATMASKKMPGLFLAGEILNVDGRIGGFNFQWAWSTGVLAGRACVLTLKG